MQGFTWNITPAEAIYIGKILSLYEPPNQWHRKIHEELLAKVRIYIALNPKVDANGNKITIAQTLLTYPSPKARLDDADDH